MSKQELAFSKLAQNCTPLTPEEMEQVSGGNSHYNPYPTVYVTGTRINPYTTSQAAAYYSSAAFYTSIGIDPSIFQVQFEPDTNENPNDPSPDDGIEGLEIITNPDGTLTATAEVDGFFDVIEPELDQFSDTEGLLADGFSQGDGGGETFITEGTSFGVFTDPNNPLSFTEQLPDTPETRAFLETFTPFPSAPLTS